MTPWVIQQWRRDHPDAVAGYTDEQIALAIMASDPTAKHRIPALSIYADQAARAKDMANGSPYDRNTVAQAHRKSIDPNTERSWAEAFKDPFKRGLLMAQQAELLTSLSSLKIKGNITQEDVAKMVRIRNKFDEIRENPHVKEFNEARGFMESAGEFLGWSETFAITYEWIASSLAGQLSHGWDNIAGGAAGGAAVGAAGGLIGGPLAGFTGTAGALYGAAAGMGKTSNDLAQAGKFLEMWEEVVGPEVMSNPDLLFKAMQDPETMKMARSKAAKYGIPIGIIDGITMGVAGRVLGVGTKLAAHASRKAAKIPTQSLLNRAHKMAWLGTEKLAPVAVPTGVEAVMGGLGEVTGQLMSEGKVKDWKAVFAEAVAEIGMAPISITAAHLTKDKSPEMAKAINDRVRAFRDKGMSLDDQLGQVDTDAAAGQYTTEQRDVLKGHVREVYDAEHRNVTPESEIGAKVGMHIKDARLEILKAMGAADLEDVKVALSELRETTGAGSKLAVSKDRATLEKWERAVGSSDIEARNELIESGDVEIVKPPKDIKEFIKRMHREGKGVSHTDIISAVDEAVEEATIAKGADILKKARINPTTIELTDFKNLGLAISHDGPPRNWKTMAEDLIASTSEHYDESSRKMDYDSLFAEAAAGLEPEEVNAINAFKDAIKRKEMADAGVTEEAGRPTSQDLYNALPEGSVGRKTVDRKTTDKDKLRVTLAELRKRQSELTALGGAEGRAAQAELDRVNSLLHQEKAWRNLAKAKETGDPIHILAALVEIQTGSPLSGSDLQQTFDGSSGPTGIGAIRHHLQKMGVENTAELFAEAGFRGEDTVGFAEEMELEFDPEARMRERYDEYAKVTDKGNIDKTNVNEKRVAEFSENNPDKDVSEAIKSGELELVSIEETLPYDEWESKPADDTGVSGVSLGMVGSRETETEAAAPLSDIERYGFNQPDTMSQLEKAMDLLEQKHEQQGEQKLTSSDLGPLFTLIPEMESTKIAEELSPLQRLKRLIREADALQSIITKAIKTTKEGAKDPNLAKVQVLLSSKQDQINDLSEELHVAERPDVKDAHPLFDNDIHKQLSTEDYGLFAEHENPPFTYRKGSRKGEQIDTSLIESWRRIATKLAKDFRYRYGTEANDWAWVAFTKTLAEAQKRVSDMKEHGRDYMNYKATKGAYDSFGGETVLRNAFFDQSRKADRRQQIMDAQSAPQVRGGKEGAQPWGFRTLAERPIDEVDTREEDRAESVIEDVADALKNYTGEPIELTPAENKHLNAVIDSGISEVGITGGLPERTPRATAIRDKANRRISDAINAFAEAFKKRMGFDKKPVSEHEKWGAVELSRRIMRDIIVPKFIVTLGHRNFIPTKLSSLYRRRKAINNELPRLERNLENINGKRFTKIIKAINSHIAKITAGKLYSEEALQGMVSADIRAGVTPISAETIVTHRSLLEDEAIRLIENGILAKNSDAIIRVPTGDRTVSISAKQLIVDIEARKIMLERQLKRIEASISVIHSESEGVKVLRGFPMEKIRNEIKSLYNEFNRERANVLDSAGNPLTELVIPPIRHNRGRFSNEALADQYNRIKREAQSAVIEAGIEEDEFVLATEEAEAFAKEVKRPVRKGREGKKWRGDLLDKDTPLGDQNEGNFTLSYAFNNLRTKLKGKGAKFAERMEPLLRLMDGMDTQVFIAEMHEYSGGHRPAFYDSYHNRIVFDPRGMSDEKAFRVMLEEGLHALTVDKLKNDRTFNSRVKRMMDRANKIRKEGGTKYAHLSDYPFDNTLEFIAHSMMDSELQEFLSGIDSSRKIRGGLGSLLQEVIDAIAKTLGLNVSEATLLDDVIFAAAHAAHDKLNTKFSAHGGRIRGVVTKNFRVVQRPDLFKYSENLSFGKWQQFTLDPESYDIRADPKILTDDQAKEGFRALRESLSPKDIADAFAQGRPEPAFAEEMELPSVSKFPKEGLTQAEYWKLELESRQRVDQSYHDEEIERLTGSEEELAQEYAGGERGAIIQWFKEFYALPDTINPETGLAEHGRSINVRLKEKLVGSLRSLGIEADMSMATAEELRAAVAHHISNYYVELEPRTAPDGEVWIPNRGNEERRVKAYEKFISRQVYEEEGEYTHRKAAVYQRELMSPPPTEAFAEEMELPIESEGVSESGSALQNVRNKQDLTKRKEGETRASMSRYDKFKEKFVTKSQLLDSWTKRIFKEQNISQDLRVPLAGLHELLSGTAVAANAAVDNFLYDLHALIGSSKKRTKQWDDYMMLMRIRERLLNDADSKSSGRILELEELVVREGENAGSWTGTEDEKIELLVLLMRSKEVFPYSTVNDIYKLTEGVDELIAELDDSSLLRRAVDGEGKQIAEDGHPVFEGKFVDAQAMSQEHMENSLYEMFEAGLISLRSLNRMALSTSFYVPFYVAKHFSGEDTFGQLITGIKEETKIAPVTEAIKFKLYMTKHRVNRNLFMGKIDEFRREFDPDGKYIRLVEGKEGVEAPPNWREVKFYNKGVMSYMQMEADVADLIGHFNPVSSTQLYGVMKGIGDVFKLGATGINVFFQLGNFFLFDPIRLLTTSKAGLRAKEKGLNPIILAHQYIKAVSAASWHNMAPHSIKNLIRPHAPNVTEGLDKLYQEFVDSGAAGSTIAEYFDKARGIPDPVGNHKGIHRNPGIISEALTTGNAFLSVIGKTLEQTAKMVGMQRMNIFEGIDELQEEIDSATSAEKSLRLKQEMRNRRDAIAVEIRNYAGSPDFMRKGTYTEYEALNVVFMFFNARIQGVERDMSRMAKVFSDSKGDRALAMATIMKLSAFAAAPTMMAWAMNRRHKDDYDEISDEEKKRYFMIPMDSRFEHPYIEGKMIRDYIRIPRRESFGLFSYTLEKGLDWLYEEDPDAVAEMVGYWVESMSPVNLDGLTEGDPIKMVESVMSSMNPAIKGTFEQATNRNFFRHKPLIPRHMEKADADEQYYETTPDVYRWLGSNTGLGALRVKHLSDSFLAGMVTQFNPPKDIGREGFASTPFLYRLSRSTYVEKTDIAEIMDSADKLDATGRVIRRRMADKFMLETRGMSVQERVRSIPPPKNHNEKLLKDLIYRRLRQQAVGLNPDEIRMINSPVSVRARVVLSQVEGMTPAEVKVYLTDLAQKRILTRATIIEVNRSLMERSGKTLRDYMPEPVR